VAKNHNKNHSKPAAPEAPAPAQNDEPKGLLARAAEAIDHVIHPDSQPKSEPDLVESSEVIEECPSKAESDYEKHPKFSKFKKGVN
jgi:hypothetical protein